MSSFPLTSSCTWTAAQVQCVGTGNPVAKTKAGATANKTPRGALFDISNDVSNSSEATKFSTPEPLKQCKTPKKEEEATQPLSLQSAMHDAAEEDVEHNDNGTPQDETSAELKEELPVEVVHEEEEEEAPVEAPEEVPAAEEVAPEAPEEMALAVEEAVHEAPEVVHEAPEEAEAAEVPAAKVLSRDAQARHLLGEVMAKIMPLDTRTEGLEDLYRFTKAFPNYDINKYMAKTKESFRQFIKTSIEEIAMREAEKELQEDMPIAAEEEQSAVETEELIDEPMETAEEEELNEEVEQIEEEELKEAVEQIEEEELNEEVEQIEEGEIGMIEDSHEAEEVGFPPLWIRVLGLLRTRGAPSSQKMRPLAPPASDRLLRGSRRRNRVRGRTCRRGHVALPRDAACPSRDPQPLLRG